MNSHGQILNSMKLRARKNWLWLWFLPAAISWLLVALARPTGGTATWVELAIICLCSCFFSFALSFKSFSTFQKRFWGGLFFSGGSLCLLSSVLFLGCFGPSSPSAAELREQWLQHKAQVAKHIVPRDFQAEPTMLDLTLFYDQLLPGQPATVASKIHSLEPGTHAWAGTKFDVRGMIMGQGQMDGAIVSIPVGKRCSGISFLHGVYGFDRNNVISRFVIHFANGQAETVPLVFDKDVASSRFWRSQGEPPLVMTNFVVWAESVSTDSPPEPYARFFIKQWSNPFPGETVTAIDLIRSSWRVNPFLVAITIRPANP